MGGREARVDTGGLTGAFCNTGFDELFNPFSIVLHGSKRERKGRAVEQEIVALRRSGRAVGAHHALVRQRACVSAII